jgi:hypothetical protein
MNGLRKGANFAPHDLATSVERELCILTAQDGVSTRGVLYRPAGRRPKVGVHLMHPNTDQSQNYTIPPLVAAGYAVLGRAGRYLNNDVAAVQERLMLDIAAGVAHLRAQGCEHVVLLGSARGGPLAALYQSQARTAPPGRLTDTAAGDPFDLNAYELAPADAIALIGPHLGGGYSMMKWIDPSVVDEADPLSVDTSLDMYHPDNGFRIPPEPSRYSAEFLARYRRAQLDRLTRLEHEARRRITRRRGASDDLSKLAEREQWGPARQVLERRAATVDHMRIHRLVADPAFTDPTIEPDDRDVCAFENDPRPDLLNYGPGYAPLLTPEAFLSTWCELTTRTRTAECLAHVTDPLVVVHYAGDPGTRMSEARSICDRSPAADKAFVLVRHADHFGFRILGPHARGDRVTEGTDAIVHWLRQRFPPA